MTQFTQLNRVTAKFITSAGALALIAGVGLGTPMPAFADDCLLDTNNDGNADSNIDTDGLANSSGNDFRLACGHLASAAGGESTALGWSANAAGGSSIALGRSANAAGTESIAVGNFASAALDEATALGFAASAAGNFSTALGYSASAVNFGATAVGNSTSAGFSSTALGRNANAAGSSSTAVGVAASTAGGGSTALGVGASAAGSDSIAVGSQANFIGDGGLHSIALGYFASARGQYAIAVGADIFDGNFIGADAQGDDSIVIGTNASDAGFDGAILVGRDTLATEADQVILKSADTFTILGNGDVGIGTAAPAGNLDVDSGASDTTLLLTNTSAVWEIKSDAGNGKMTFTNKTTGTIPFKFSPNAVGGLLRVGIVTNDQVDIKGDLVTTGTLTTGGPTCGGGCDAVFGADYDLPSIEEHAAQMFANKHLPAVGPTIPLAPVNVSEKMGDMLNELEKAHIYIAQQETRLNQQSAELKLIKAQIALLMTP